MATVTFSPNSSMSVYNMVQARLDFPSLLNSYTQATLSSSEISLRSSSSNRTVISGDNLTYTTDDGKLVITGGTIEQISIRFNSSSPTITFSNLNLDAGEFGALLNDGSANMYDLILAGNDTVSGAVGNDILKGFAGNDTLNGLDGNDTLNGDVGNDRLNGGNNNDRLNGGTGNDTEYGDAGNDSLYGEDGNDSAYGGAGNDTLSGGIGNDRLNGDAGNDKLLGGDGNDTFNGGAGNDLLYGELGKDNLTGGDGSDTFFFTKALGSSNIDTINDFNANADTIRLENGVFLTLANGTLSAAAFQVHNSGNAQDASDRIVYEQDTGKLFYDRDGTGAAHSKVHFATLDSGLALTNADFFVI